MFADVDLRELSELTAPDRAFLSIYLAGPSSVDDLESQIARLSRSLKAGTAEKDERDHLDENFRSVRRYLKPGVFTSGSLCIFSCWLLDFFEVIPLTIPVEDLIWIDSSPYLRPLAELQDEYETVAVVVADNKSARIFLVSSAVAQDAETIKGNVKNHVRKGGWSQQRYERRRDKQLLLYAKEIVDELKSLDQKEAFRRIVLVGGKEVLRSVEENLPQSLKDKCVVKATDLSKGEEIVNRDLMEIFVEQERQSEIALWDKIREEYLRGGLGTVGIEAVFSALDEGRVESIILRRDLQVKGVRCRECEALIPAVVAECPSCGSGSNFPVDVINELTEIAAKTGASVDFADAMETLDACGGIAALLRY